MFARFALVFPSRLANVNAAALVERTTDVLKSPDLMLPSAETSRFEVSIELWYDSSLISVSFSGGGDLPRT